MLFDTNISIGDFQYLDTKQSDTSIKLTLVSFVQFSKKVVKTNANLAGDCVFISDSKFKGTFYAFSFLGDILNFICHNTPPITGSNEGQCCE